MCGSNSLQEYVCSGKLIYGRGHNTTPFPEKKVVKVEWYPLQLPHSSLFRPKSENCTHQESNPAPRYLHNFFLRKRGGVMAYAIYQFTTAYVFLQTVAPTHKCFNTCLHLTNTLDVLAFQTFFSFEHLNKPRPNGRPLGNPNTCKSTQLLHTSFPVASSCCYRADPIVCSQLS